MPPEIIKSTPELVLGCIGIVSHKDLTVPVVVFDVGPHHNWLGEGSPALASEIGVNDSLTGGVDTQSVFYRIWPGVAARLSIGGRQFNL
jgi:hypothetical protein